MHSWELVAAGRVRDLQRAHRLVTADHLSKIVGVYTGCLQKISSLLKAFFNLKTGIYILAIPPRLRAVTGVSFHMYIYTIYTHTCKYPQWLECMNL